MKKYWIIGFVLLLTGCLQSTVEESETPIANEEKFEINVPADFNWSPISEKHIIVTLKDGNKKTTALDSTLIELYDSDGLLLDALSILDGQAEFYVRTEASTENLKLILAANGQEKIIPSETEEVDFNVQNIHALYIDRIDSDKDGLFDSFDVEPFNDKVAIALIQTQGKTLKSSQAKQSSSSSYAIFEDLWPSKGDYDFNDLVVRTSYSWTRGKGNYIESATVNCVVEYIGAGLDLGLGYELFENKGTNLYYRENLITGIEGAETAPDMTNGIIAFNSIKTAGTTNFQFTVTFKNKALKSFLFIPFLFRTENPGQQVRPYGTPPTKSHNMELFGSYDDSSPKTWSWDPGTKFKYPLSGTSAFFRTKENHPWGIEFISKKKFKPCKESRSITKEYPNFKIWAESGGKYYSNWYDFAAE